MTLVISKPKSQLQLKNKSEEPELNPTSSKERINSIDIIRGIAVLGILIMNIVGFGLAFAYDDPTIAGGSDGWNFRTWAFNELFVEGTMRGLFTMLFGAGFIIFISKGLMNGAGILAADYYYRRILWLLIFGIIHAYFLLWHGEILFTYAICGMMLFAFRKSNPRLLVLLASGLLMIGTMQFYKDHSDNLEIRREGRKALELMSKNIPLSETNRAYLEKWKDKEVKREIIEKENTILQEGSYFSIFKHRYPRSVKNQTIHLYKYNVWDSLSFMLIGMAFFTWGIFQAKKSRRFYLLMMIIGYAIGLSFNFYELNIITSNNFEFTALSQAKITYHAGRLAMTIGHIGLILLFIKSGRFKFFQNALADVGKMAFTNYIVQTLICIAIFMGFGLGLFGQLQRFQLYFIVAGIWLVQLIYSPIWFRYFKYGPMEWIWRSLTYSKIQPFRNKFRSGQMRNS